MQEPKANSSPHHGTRAAPPPVAGAQAVRRAFAVLRVVGARGNSGASLSRVVEETRLNKPTAHRLLAALAAEGVVEHDPVRSLYYVGAECCALGGAAMRRLGYRGKAADAVARIAQATGDSAFFCLRSGTYSVCVLREEGDYELQARVLAPSTRRPLGIGAAGLSMLAALADDEVDACLLANERILQEKYPQVGPALLRKLIRQTRAAGYAVNEGLILRGAWGMGVTVRSPDGAILGAFSIGAVESRLDDAARQRKIAPILQAEAQRLEEHLRGLEMLRQARRPVRAPAAAPAPAARGTHASSGPARRRST